MCTEFLELCLWFLEKCVSFGLGGDLFPLVILVDFLDLILENVNLRFNLVDGILNVLDLHFVKIDLLGFP